MAGPWKAWKTKPRFPPLSTVPWKSGPPRRISTFPPPRRFLFPFPQKPKLKKGSRPLRGFPIQIASRIILHWIRYLASGSSLDWKMLDWLKCTATVVFEHDFDVMSLVVSDTYEATALALQMPCRSCRGSYENEESSKNWTSSSNVCRRGSCPIAGRQRPIRRMAAFG